MRKYAIRIWYSGFGRSARKYIPQCIFKVDESYNKYRNRFFLFTIAQLIACYAVEGYAHVLLITDKEPNKNRELLFTTKFMDNKTLMKH